MFSLIILKLNNDLREDPLELILIGNPYNFMSELVLGNKFGFRTTTRRNSDVHYRAA